LLSRSNYSYDELRDTVRSRLEARWDFKPTEDQIKVARAHFADFGNPSSVKIAKALLEIAERPACKVGIWSMVNASFKARVRKTVKTINAYRSDHKNSKAYSDKRFPEIGLDEVAKKIERFREIEPRFASIRVRPLRSKIFEISDAA
jgi:hypothetical protein